MLPWYAIHMEVPFQRTSWAIVCVPCIDEVIPSSLLPQEHRFSRLSLALHDLTELLLPSGCIGLQRRLALNALRAKLVLKPVTFKTWNHTLKKSEKNNNNKNQKNKNSTSVSANKNNQESKMLSQNSEKANCGQSPVPLNNPFCSPSLSCLSFPHLLPALH